MGVDHFQKKMRKRVAWERVGGEGGGGRERRREHRRISDCKEGCEIGLRMECFARGPTAKTTKFFFPARTSARASRNKSHLAPIPESFLGSEKKNM